MDFCLPTTRVENYAARFCSELAFHGDKDLAIEWKILGNEKNGSLLVTWISVRNDGSGHSCIGQYIYGTRKEFKIIHRFPTKLNLIQATINESGTLLAYVTKTLPSSDSISVALYKAYLVEIMKTNNQPALELTPTNGIPNQVMVKFLWLKKLPLEKSFQDKLLVLTHKENVQLFTLTISSILIEEEQQYVRGSNNLISNPDHWQLETDSLKSEILIKNFTWAQWDNDQQCLYYIHLKAQAKMSLDKNDEQKLNPMLSVLQFNDNLPRETVLNIPLNLPSIPRTNSEQSINTLQYEDDPIPLRIHDSSLNLIIVSVETGMLFVCHYYLYQPNKPDDDDENSLQTVHFAYSVTTLHHGCVVHCVMPGVPWDKAKLMKPTFIMWENSYLMVFQSGLFMHLLDVGNAHEPCCHIVGPSFTKQQIAYLVPLSDGLSIGYDSATMDIIYPFVSKHYLLETFKSDSSLENRLSILHYFMVHANMEVDILPELLTVIMEQPLSLDTVSMLKEILIGGTFSYTSATAGKSHQEFIDLLPLTNWNIKKPIQTKVTNIIVGLSHEKLYNTSMMLLSPGQRLSPYKTDIWKLLWEKIKDDKEHNRFCSQQVTEKLLFSLACYQPEALSKCATPKTPLTDQIWPVSDFMAFTKRNQADTLPFIEFESCTATKQEHVISVNLRELSSHLMKNCEKRAVGFRWMKDDVQQPTPYIYAIASQYSTAQIELTRILCIYLCRSCGVDTRFENIRGFQLIDQISHAQRYMLFLILERYCLACESLAFPLPQGFSSFFTYLGFKALPYEMFIQYTERFVFELQIDAMKLILTDIDDSQEGIARKLHLLSLLPRSRTQRLLNNWNHPISLMIRGREHVQNILTGNQLSLKNSNHSKKPLETIQSSTSDSKEKLTPLDSFLDLLTAKANLNELDFNLLIDATIGSINETIN